MNSTDQTHWVIVGLGNPGKEYALTRHNMGYLVAQGVAYSYGWSFKEDKQFKAHVAKGRLDDTVVHLLLPLTYMNESGWAVKAYLDFYRMDPQQLLVITDDVELPYGAVRLRTEGGSGGHNGLKSIQSHMQTTTFARLRMGVGREQQQDRSLADYVLDPFSQEEYEQLPSFIERGINVVTSVVDADISSVMNSINIRS